MVPTKKSKGSELSTIRCVVSSAMVDSCSDSFTVRNVYVFIKVCRHGIILSRDAILHYMVFMLS